MTPELAKAALEFLSRDLPLVPREINAEYYVADGVHLTAAGYDVLWQTVGSHMSL